MAAWLTWRPSVVPNPNVGCLALGAGRRQGGKRRTFPVVSLQTPSCAAPVRAHNRGPTRPEATCRSRTRDQGTGPAARPLWGSGWAEDFLCGGLSQGTVRAPDR